MSESAVGGRVSVCGIGASAGGVEALQQFFESVAPDLGVAYVVIVHLAPDHKSELPAILSRWTPMPVIQVGDSQQVPLQRDHVYVIAPDRKLEITDSAVGASPFDQPRGQRTAIDSFFRSLAVTHGDGFAVLLSGSGSDGAIGARAVKERGGLILVQDPEEAAHSGMPRAAIATGVADVVLPVRDLAGRLGELVRAKTRMPVSEREPDLAVPDDDERALKSVLDVLRKRTGHDFSKYKRSTVMRRLARRMQLARQLTVQDYLKFLRASVSEPQALLNDLLISVTMFFRDAEAWAALQQQVIGPLVEQSDPDSQLRVWVPGCATGEEAYTMALLFCEEFERRKRPAHFVVFASDVDESALAVAREGLYPQAISADVSDARLERYFRAEDDQYRITTEVRDHLVFAAHSLLRDPPFSRVHVISCRNLLIYLDRELQDQIMSVFRYACRDDATLFLGLSESASDELFHPVDKKHRIFGMRPREGDGRPALPDILNTAVPRVRSGREPRVPASTTAAELHLATLEQTAPPSVLVDERWNVVHVSPTAARFFQQAAGALARRLTDLVRSELRDETHALLQHALDGADAQLSAFVPVRFNGAAHRVALLAQRRPATEDGRRDILVTFLDAGVGAASDTNGTDPEPSNEVVSSLRQRLRQTEQRVEAMRDEHHLTTEDLRAANEELQSLNEEYRSTTEELETSKEELQSINEELHTVNHELKIKLEEVSRAHSDVENLMAAADVPMLFLTPDLRIKRFTPQLGDIFKVKSRDLERPISDLKHSLDYDLEEDARRVLATVTALEREARSDDGRRFIVRLGPYRTASSREVDGVVATFVDVTHIKNAEESLRESEARLAAELDIMRRLHAMTLSVATSPDMTTALEHVLTAAIDLHDADFGNVQLLERETNTLRIVAQKGFESEFLEGFARVSADDSSACGRALRTNQVVQIADVSADPEYAPYRAVAAEAGYRAVQSTPLVDKTGAVVGVLSVHFRQVHAFSERDRQLTDVIAQVAANLIEHRAQHDYVVQLNEDLRRQTLELKASRDQLIEQAEELKRQDRHREEFLAALGHELRNPLAAILSSLALVTAADDRSRKALTVLRRQSDHMNRLINDLLDVTRVRYGKLRLQRTATDLNSTVAAAIDAASPLGQRKGLTITSDLPASILVVNADAERLAQVFDNLLRNAISYTDRGGITLRVTKEGEVARIAVQDSGIGIDPKMLETLFDPYQRGNHDRQGLGLGLTLVKALVEAHGGTISAHSDGPGSGSEFVVTMPLVAMPVPETAPAAVTAPPTRRVLVVDDEHDVADMLVSVLESLGQEVVVAYDAESAVALAREHRPQVAFIDASMPGVDGAELSRRLRDQFAPEQLTLIAVSGHDKQDERFKASRFDQHLLKPATLESIMAALNAVDDADSSSAT